jgi:hypothetical protein
MKSIERCGDTDNNSYMPESFQMMSFIIKNCADKKEENGRAEVLELCKSH